MPMPFVRALAGLVGSAVVARSEDVLAEKLAGGQEDLVVLACSEWSEAALPLLRALHGAVAPTPLLIVSGPCEASARVTALASGADDFLNIPFTVDEFTARVRALARRSPHLRWGPLRIDTARQLAHVDGRELALTPSEFRILFALARNGDRVTTRADLVQQVGRAARHRASNWLDVHVNAIRQKLGEHASLVETVRGLGYRLSSARSAREEA